MSWQNRHYRGGGGKKHVDVCYTGVIDPKSGRVIFSLAVAQGAGDRGQETFRSGRVDFVQSRGFSINEGS